MMRNQQHTLQNMSSQDRTNKLSINVPLRPLTKKS